MDKLDLLALVSVELSKSRIDPQFTKKLLKATQYSKPHVKGAVAESLCLNLPLLAPVFPQVLGAIKGLWSDLTTPARSHVVDALLELWDANSYLLRPGVSRVYYVRLLAEDEGARSLGVLQDIFASAQSDPVVRRDVILAIAKRRQVWWLSRRIPRFDELGSPNERRAFLAATGVMTEDAVHFVKRVRQSLTPLEQLIAKWAEEARGRDQNWVPPI